MDMNGKCVYIYIYNRDILDIVNIGIYLGYADIDINKDIMGLHDYMLSGYSIINSSMT